MATDFKRTQRVAERIRDEITEVILRGKLKDPRLAQVVISGVTVTDDLQHARVHVRSLAHEVDEHDRRTIVKLMNGAAAFLRRELGATLQLRFTPDLKFFWDDVVDEAERVRKLLEEIKHEA
jgi:ribosome-binding factor A